MEYITSRHRYDIRSHLTIATCCWISESCASYTGAGGCCRFAARSMKPCSSGPVHVLFNICWWNKHQKHEEAPEEIQNAGHGSETSSDLVLVEENAEGHVHRFHAPRDPKDKKQLAVQDLGTYYCASLEENIFQIKCLYFFWFAKVKLWIVLPSVPEALW